MAGGTYGGVFGASRDADGNLPPAPGRGNKGRFPANVCHDGSPEVLAGFPSPHGAGYVQPPQDKWKTDKKYFGTIGAGACGARYGDSGSAARFFYTAKASRSERNAGLEGMEARTKQGERPNSPDLTGKFPEHDHRQSGGNNHPTVKPIALMRWLVRLVTPPGGVILDHFMGSGTTGCAAVLEGFDFIGCDLDADYVEISRRRIDHWSKQQPTLL